MSTTRCEHGQVISDTMGTYRCAECDPTGRIEELKSHVETLREALKLAVARLSRVDGGDSMTVSNGLDALAETGDEFDVEAFIEDEDREEEPA